MSAITKYHKTNEFLTPERCSINELLNHSNDQDCSIAKASVAPGITTQLHAVKHTIERYIILQGEAEVTINHARTEKVNYLDSVTIPAGQPQKIKNCGQTELIFLCICTPRFQQANYINLEEHSMDKHMVKQPDVNDQHCHTKNVSCKMHSELELAIMHHQLLDIHYYDHTHNTGKQALIKHTLRPYDLITRSVKNNRPASLTGEFLLCSSNNNNHQEFEIRLDLIQHYSAHIAK